MLILVAPPLFAASIYMTLGRLILYLDAESASLLRVKYIAKIFVVGDIISFLLQCGGTYTLLYHHNLHKVPSNRDFLSQVVATCPPAASPPWKTARTSS